MMSRETLSGRQDMGSKTGNVSENPGRIATLYYLYSNTPYRLAHQ